MTPNDGKTPMSAMSPAIPDDPPDVHDATVLLMLAEMIRTQRGAQLDPRPGHVIQLEMSEALADLVIAACESGAAALDPVEPEIVLRVPFRVRGGRR